MVVSVKFAGKFEGYLFRYCPLLIDQCVVPLWC